MKLEYQVAAVGFDQLRRTMRSVDEEARRLAVQGERREMIAAKRRNTAVKTQGKARLSDEERVARARAKIEQVQIREAEKADRYWRTQHTKAQRDRVKAHEREQTILRNQTRRAEALKIREASVSAKRIEREEAKALRSRQATAARITRGAGRVVSGAVGAVGTGLRVLGGAAAIGGTLAVGNAIRTQMNEAALASQLANQAGNPALKGQLLKESQGVKGFTGEETLGALSGFVEKTGDLEAGRKVMQSMGQLALATSADFGELGEAAGQAFNVIRDQISDPKKQIEALNDVMTTLAAQGTMGAVEIKDMASELASLGAASRKYQGGPVELLKTMGAMAQATVARGGAPTAAEASTAIVRFGEDLTKKPAQKALAGLGVNVFADKGKTILKDPAEIMADIMAKTGGDQTKLQDILNAQSIRALQGFSPLYLDAEKKQKGSGKSAMMAEFARFSGASLSKEDLAARANSRLEDTDLQFKEAMKQFNAALGSQLLPVVTKLIPKFTEMVPVITDIVGKGVELAGWLAENPWKGAFAGMGILIGKELAVAGIGKATSWGVEKLLAAIAGKASAGLPGSVSTLVSSMLPAMMNPIGLGVAAAVAAAIGGYAMYQSHTEQAAGSQGYQNQQDNERLRKSLAGTTGEPVAKDFAARAGFDAKTAGNIQNAFLPGAWQPTAPTAPPQQAAPPNSPDLSKADKALTDAATKLSQAASALQQNNKFGPIVRM